VLSQPNILNRMIYACGKLTGEYWLWINQSERDKSKQKGTHEWT